MASIICRKNFLQTNVCIWKGKLEQCHLQMVLILTTLWRLASSVSADPFGFSAWERQQTIQSCCYVRQSDPLFHVIHRVIDFYSRHRVIRCCLGHRVIRYWLRHIVIRCYEERRVMGWQVAHSGAEGRHGTHPARKKEIHAACLLFKSYST